MVSVSEFKDPGVSQFISKVSSVFHLKGEMFKSSLPTIAAHLGLKRYEVINHSTVFQCHVQVS